MGMLWAFDSLYVSGNGPEGRGIYRCKDTDGDGLPDTAVMWKKVPGGSGEHGAHALILSPDKKNIYIVHGNATGLIDGIAPDSPYRNWGEDDLIPKLKDPTATFFDNIKAPYGYVVRTDEEGKKWELIAGGFRNPYDIDFNTDGELFTYDSDMEWDRGLPWYRPTRVLHIVPGGEYGFREGSAKMPAYYPDTLPAVVDIGLGCPTGVKFGTTAAGWPSKYRTAFFACDWTYGRILAVHLKEKGASYTATNPLKSTTFPKDAESSADVEPFVVGKGMPVTDVEFLKDGSMVFTTGGRGTSAGLYRVSYGLHGQDGRDGQNGRAEPENARPSSPLSPLSPSNNAATEKKPGGIPWNRPEKWEGQGPFKEDPKQREEAGITAEQIMEVRSRLDAIAEEVTELKITTNYGDDGTPEQRTRLKALEREYAEIVDPKRVRNIGPLVPFRDGFEILRDSEAFGRLSKEEQKQQKLRLARCAARGQFVPGIPEKIGQELIYDLKSVIEDENVQHTTFKLSAYGRIQTQRKDTIAWFVWIVWTHGHRPPREDLGMLLGMASNPEHASEQVDLMDCLKLFPLKDLPDDLKLLKLRILQLTFARHGRPSEEWQKLGLEKLLAAYPATPSPKETPKEGGRPGPLSREAAPATPSGNPSGVQGAETAPLLEVSRTAELNRALSQLLVWLSQPELGDLTQVAAAKPKDGGVEQSGGPAKSPGAATQQSGAAVQPSGEGAEQSETPVKSSGKPVESSGAAVKSSDVAVESSGEDKKASDVPEKSKGLRGTYLASNDLQRDPSKPVPNPGAVEHKGRKGQLFHAELGQQVIEKTLALMDAAPSQEEQISYALVLRWAHGWTPQQRERYFRWFHEKAARFPGGNSMQGFIRKIHTEAMVRLNDTERAALNQWLIPLTGPAPELISPRGPVKEWTLAGLEKELDALKDYKPDLARGKAFFAEAQCSRCHLFKDTGGNVGPDLTAVAQRFQRHDILEAITDPNKVVSDQYSLTTLTVIKFGGGEEAVTGLLQEETSGTIRILTDALSGATREFYHNVVKKKEKAAVSIMPPALLNIMTAEEVADLLAFLGR